MENMFMQQCLIRSLLSAKEAGKAILEVYRGDIDVEYKEDNSPLTLADERAHYIIKNHLTQSPLGHIPLLSEEGKHNPYDVRRSWKYFWLVDPLDGTKEFVKRRGEFTVNIALMHQNRPVLAVLLVPEKGSVYFAAAGLGSFRLEDVGTIEQILADRGNPEETSLTALLAKADRLPLQRAKDKQGKRMVLVGSRSHGTGPLAEFVKTLEERYAEVEFIPAGSALKFALIAEGHADIYPRFGPTMEWDTAAGQCIVEQSGGSVLRMGEQTPLDYNKRDLRNPYFVCVGKYSKDLEFPLEYLRQFRTVRQDNF